MRDDEAIRLHHQAVGQIACERGERGIELGLVARRVDRDGEAELPGLLLDDRALELQARVQCVGQDADAAHARHDLPQELEPLAVDIGHEECHAGGVEERVGQVGGDSRRDRVRADS